MSNPQNESINEDYSPSNPILTQRDVGEEYNVVNEKTSTPDVQELPSNGLVEEQKDEEESKKDDDDEEPEVKSRGEEQADKAMSRVIFCISPTAFLVVLFGITALVLTTYFIQKH
ncbi:hypothetical protein EIN_371760 [Entamoeba invadens IP1]|uniref:Uncharacterized protein n=1 Tax=Entamoeba invadens IP1 TaxID=370355 RepID=A0A0A1UFM4_ENTIV|nr:hypothetical protein EIN_371760 [Entamoeba invadens IP1]ELP92764.1 hypothetical protein EIN_371760 [Entamoeba invadens IP1]|eukprot:XP_004259535.1 hypothetical protein EIN_371760 [Entamoeba invadens IP1]